MKTLLALFFLLIATAFSSAPAQFKPDTRNVWYVPSPDHGQTFSYGSEQRRYWMTKDPDKHLALLLNYTNDPYVDRTNPRQYDSFIFNFPNVLLGADGTTFYYRAKSGRKFPVAAIKRDFFGIKEIHLTPNSHLEIKKPHGYLTVRLVVEDHGPIDGMP